MDLTVVGNLVEAAIWLIISIVVAVLAVRSTGKKRRLYSVLAAAYLAFSLSDVIESRTGAWWRPFWLLLLKGACVAIFLYVTIEFWRLRRVPCDKSTNPSDSQDSGPA